jgi:hypothetical protein
MTRQINLWTPLEAEEQIAVVQYLELKGHKFTAVPNETGSSMEARRRAIRLKRQGVRKGFPDLIIIVNDQLIIAEMKRKHGGTVSKEQREWVEALKKAGIPTEVCRGAKEAIEFIKSFERK